ncbi:hypothetical protein XENTR_v10003029 [Xenopus tropicalis]|nr:hypothetical protein XENTR_v10003029 [Xenopus tropicalis]
MNFLATMKRSISRAYASLLKCQQPLPLIGVSSRHFSKDEHPVMPPCDFEPVKYESDPFERILEIRKQRIAPSLYTIYKKPLLLHQGHKQWLFDNEGRRYLDLIAGIVTVSVGHCHPKITEAAHKQFGRLCHTSNIFLNPPIHEYAEKLTDLLPGKLKVVYFTNSGTEANELAMQMARVYTGNCDIISLRGGYHGSGPTAVSVTAVASYKPGVATSSNCYTTMCPDVFHGIWGGSHCRDSPVQTIRKCSCSPGCCEAKDQYIDQFKETLCTSTGQRVAAFIAEPIQGVGGAVQYPKGFLKEAYNLVRERGGLCIADEVQTGFGRTGSHYWGFQTHDVIEEEGLQKNCEVIGTQMLLEFAKLRDMFEIIGDVRGKGLMIGIEMVKDKESRKPLAAQEMNLIWEDCKDMGVLFGKGGIYGQTFRIKPPMCVTSEDVAFAADVFHRALTRHMERSQR